MSNIAAISQKRGSWKKSDTVTALAAAAGWLSGRETIAAKTKPAGMSAPIPRINSAFRKPNQRSRRVSTGCGVNEPNPIAMKPALSEAAGQAPGIAAEARQIAATTTNDVDRPKRNDIMPIQRGDFVTAKKDRTLAIARQPAISTS